MQGFRFNAVGRHTGTRTSVTSSALRATLAEQLTTAMASIHRRGWCDGTGGNFSCVLQREPLQLLMAPSGVDKGSVTPDALILVDANGSVIEGTGKASAETALHLMIIKTCGAGSVLHTHSQAGTLLSRLAIREARTVNPRQRVAGVALEGLEMLKGLDGINTHESSVVLPVLENDQDVIGLSERARELIIEAPHGLLIAGHGLYAWGKTLQEAIRHLEILEFLLEQHWRLQLLDALQAHQSTTALQQIDI